MMKTGECVLLKNLYLIVIQVSKFHSLTLLDFRLTILLVRRKYEKKWLTDQRERKGHKRYGKGLFPTDSKTSTYNEEIGKWILKDGEEESSFVQSVNSQHKGKLEFTEPCRIEPVGLIVRGGWVWTWKCQMRNRL